MRRRAPVLLPASFTVTDGGAPLVSTLEPYRSAEPIPAVEFRLVRQWLSFQSVLLSAFALFWDLTMISFISEGAGLLVTFHVLAGAGLTYYALAGLVNRTTITAHAGVLTVRHGPLPWPGNHTIATDDLQQLYCQEITETKRRSVQTTYSVLADLKSGATVTLLSKLPDADQALFVEQTIEDRLGIEDVPVWGELPP